jgi:hypothetical protein
VSIGRGWPAVALKQPRRRKDNMEHVSEKIAQEIASLLDVPCADIELAQYGDVKGTISRDVCQAGEALVHGNEIIAGRVTGYRRDGECRTSDHTIELILQAIKEVCAGHCLEDVRQFAGYVVLDALIGNTDRHHENWALPRRDESGTSSYRLAPSFDHASSLGREMFDERRNLLLQENRIEKYLLRGRGGIYLTGLSNTPVSPLKLVESLSAKMSSDLQPAVRQK